MPAAVRNSAEWVHFDALASSYREEPLHSESVKSDKTKTLEDAVATGLLEVVVECCRTPEGLVTSQLRSKLWPLLLSVETEAPSGRLGFLDPQVFDDLPAHKDEDQILLDIRRLFTVMSQFHLFQPVSSSYTTIFSNDDVEAMRKRLFSLIVRVLRRYPCLNYYQGYHDVASVVLLICSESDDHDDLAYRLLEKLTVCHLRDFMIADIGLSINHLKLIPTLIEEVDPALFDVIHRSSNLYLALNGYYYDYKFFQALLLVLTLFSHDVASIQHLLVIWDFLLSYNSVAVSIYVYVACMLQFKDEIMAQIPFSLDPDLVHTLLSPTNLFSGLTDANLTQILACAQKLIVEHPLDSVSNSEDTVDTWFREYNSSSVLLTSSRLGGDTKEFQKLFDNETLAELISQQEMQQRREAAHEADLFVRALEQESLATSINSLEDDLGGSRESLLSSSLSSLTAASSAINNKLASSLFFRRLFSREEEEDNDKHISRRNRNSHLLANVYKISFTIGFIGFMLHFLIKHNDSHPGVNRFFHPESLKASARSLFGKDVSVLGSEVSSMGKVIATEVATRVGDFMTYMKDSEVVNRGLDISQVGLGTLRNSIYAFGD